VVIEGARDFYERAVVDFIKHDDAESAADLHFAVLNLTEHGHLTHPEDEQILLRAHSILVDNGVDDNLLKAKARQHDRKKTSEPEGAFDPEKIGRFNRHTAIPTSQTQTGLSPPIVTLSDGRRLDAIIDPIRWRERIWENETGRLDKNQHKELRKTIARAFRSHMPRTMSIDDEFQITDPQLGYERGRSPYADLSHALEMLALFPEKSGLLKGSQERADEHESGITKLVRAMYSNRDSEHHVSELDKRRKEHEEEYSKHPHNRIFGEYVHGDDDINGHGPMERMYQIGLDNYKQEYREKFKGKEPEDKEFLEHQILRNMGVPDATIWTTMYDEDGGFTQEGFEKAAENRYPDRFGLGLLGWLLGTEMLPEEQALNVVSWHLDGGKGNIEGFQDSHKMGNTIHRIFNERLAWLQNAITSDPHDPGKAVPHLDSGGAPSVVDDDYLQYVSGDDIAKILEEMTKDGNPKSEGEDSLMDDILSEHGTEEGMLPNVVKRTEKQSDGSVKHTYEVSDKNGKITSNLINKYVNAGIISESAYEKIVDQMRMKASKGRPREIMSDAMSAMEGPYRPMKDSNDLTKKTEMKPSAVKPVYDVLSHGGLGYGDMDVAAMLDDMYPGFHFEEVSDLQIPVEMRASKVKGKPREAGKFNLGTGKNVLGDMNLTDPETMQNMMSLLSPNLLLKPREAMSAFVGMLAGANVQTADKSNLHTLSRTHKHARNQMVSQPADHIRSLRSYNKRLADGDQRAFLLHDEPDASRRGSDRPPLFSHGNKRAQRDEDDLHNHHGTFMHLGDLIFGLSRPHNENHNDFNLFVNGFPTEDGESVSAHDAIRDFARHVMHLDNYDPLMGGSMTPTKRAKRAGLMKDGEDFKDLPLDRHILYNYNEDDETNPLHTSEQIHSSGARVHAPHVIGALNSFSKGNRGSLPNIQHPSEFMVRDENGIPIESSLSPTSGEIHPDFRNLFRLDRNGNPERISFEPDLEGQTTLPNFVRHFDEEGENQKKPISDFIVYKGGYNQTTGKIEVDKSKPMIIGPHPNIIMKNILDHVDAGSSDIRNPEKYKEAHNKINNLFSGSEEERVKAAQELLAPSGRMKRYQDFLYYIRSIANQGDGKDAIALSQKDTNRNSYMVKAMMQSYYAGIPIAKGLLYQLMNDPDVSNKNDFFYNNYRSILPHLLEMGIEGARRMTPEAREEFADHLSKMGMDKEIVEDIRSHSTAPVFNSTTRVDDMGVDLQQRLLNNLRDALTKNPKSTGLDLMQHYAEQIEDENTRKSALKYLKKFSEITDKEKFMEAHPFHKGGRPSNEYNEMSAFLPDLLDSMRKDAMAFPDSNLNLPRYRTGKGGTKNIGARLSARERDVSIGNVRIFDQKAAEKMHDFMHSRVGMNALDLSRADSGLSSIRFNRNTSLPIHKDNDGNTFRPLPVFNSPQLRRSFGRMVDIPMNINFGDGTKRPEIKRAPNGYRRLQIMLPRNVIKHAYGSFLPNISQRREFGELSNEDVLAETQSSAMLSSNPPAGQGVEDLNETFRYSFDVLTDHDLLLKDEDRDKGEFLPIKAMHRIFDVEDLIHLRGFTGDWVVSIWPEGERVIVTKDKKKIEARGADGDEFSLPNSVKEGVRELNKADEYTLDGVWDGSHLHIVDIVECGDEDMENMPTKDRIRHLRATFESNENVSVPAPINTRRTDDVGLGESIEGLLAEPKAEQILLRDADATYMRGENRHPKWVLLSSGKRLDVRVLSISGGTARVGVGPIYEDVADDIGNRSVEYDDKHYMDVGTVQVKDVEEGDYITVVSDSITHNKRKGHDLYRLNGAKYEKDSEAGATDSVETMGIMSGNPIDTPHRVRVSKGKVIVNLTGLGMDVIYKADEVDGMWMVHDPDAPHTYAQNLADSQRPYWATSAAILLRSEKERKKDEEKHDEKAHVEVEPLANHNKKPKKVDEDQFFKRGLITALEMIEHMLKEKTTFTGPKGLGIDYATPGNFNTGGTELIDQSALPDYDPVVRRKPREDPKKRGRKSLTINSERGDRAVVESDSEGASINLRNNRD